MDARLKELRRIICAYCREAKSVQFPGEVNTRRYCNRTYANKHRGLQLAGCVPTQAVEARRTQADLRALLQAREQFGPLTAREVAIWGHGEARGYRQGYAKGYTQLSAAASRRVA